MNPAPNRYNYQATHTEGTLVCDREAAPGSTGSFTATGLNNGTKYNFSAFTYDEVGNYSETAHIVSGRVKMSQNWRFKNAVYDEGGAGCRNRFF